MPAGGLVKDFPEKQVSGGGVRLLPGQWGQFLDPGDRVIGDPVQHIPQVAEGLHPVPDPAGNGGLGTL